MTITPADVKTKIAEITGPGGFFELEDYAIGDRSYPIYKYGPKTATEVLQNSRAHGTRYPRFCVSQSAAFFGRIIHQPLEQAAGF